MERVLETLRSGRRFLLTAHRNPDGDAVGSVLGMWHALRASGREAVAWMPDGVPESYQFLPGAESVVLQRPSGGRYDATLVMDCGDPSLLPEGMPSKEEGGPVVVIDHHGTYRDYGDVVLRLSASAVGEIVYRLVQTLGWPIDAAAATALYTSILTDTGSFAYATTSAEVLRIGADLVERGAEPWLVYSHSFERWPPERLTLLRLVLETLEVRAGGRVASLFASQDMLARAAATSEMLEGFVNYARKVRGVEAAALVSEAADGSVRVSLRSQGRIDVARVAASFGGGGHRDAAGFRAAGPTVSLAGTRSRVVEAMERAVAEAPGVA